MAYVPSDAVMAKVDQIESMLAGMATFPADRYDELSEVLDRAPEEALELIVRRKIKFMWMLAARRLREKFGRTVRPD